MYHRECFFIETSKLIEYGEECGFDRNEVKELLEGEQYQANVMEGKFVKKEFDKTSL